MSETTAIAYGTAIAVSIALTPYVFVTSRRWLRRRRDRRKAKQGTSRNGSLRDA